MRGRICFNLWMAQKPETVFRAKLRKRLDAIPDTWWESISQKSIIGTPDILGCVGPFFVAIEVKSKKGKPSPLQQLKIDKIIKTGSLAYVVYPDNMDEILTKLESLSKRSFNLWTT